MLGFVLPQRARCATPYAALSNAPCGIFVHNMHKCVALTVPPVHRSRSGDAIEGVLPSVELLFCLQPTMHGRSVRMTCLTRLDVVAFSPPLLPTYLGESRRPLHIPCVCFLRTLLSLLPAVCCPVSETTANRIGDSARGSAK